MIFIKWLRQPLPFHAVRLLTRDETLSSRLHVQICFELPIRGMQGVNERCLVAVSTYVLHLGNSFLIKFPPLREAEGVGSIPVAARQVIHK